ncbi:MULTISPECIES: type II toxin-antitoxin system HicA family toxin [unclassified Enterococcus]|jgi:predicted RNA binding protein YcfA (HicA-like mRNA interferase family)|uniref:type II toxin-antitoxin system HicA family toxin n=1 Tax=unclassified Enterococcus TaxID=2608891 RepID=UPI003D2DA40D
MPMTIREAEKLLKEAGFVEVKGGKGSHRKLLKIIFRDLLFLPVIQKSYLNE